MDIMHSTTDSSVHEKEISIAKINGENISFCDFKKWLDSKNIPIEIVPYSEISKKLFDIFLEGIILEKSNEYIGFSKNTALSPESPLKLSELKRYIIKDFKTEIREEEMKNFYNKNVGNFSRKKQHRFYHLLVESEEELQNLLQFFRNILSETKDHTESVFKLGRYLSDRDSLNRRWGDLGWVCEDRFPTIFAENVSSLKEIENYITFQSTLGYHFVMLMHIREPRIYSFEEVRKFIKNELQQEKEKELWEKFIEKLKSKYFIKISYHNLKKALRDEEKKKKMILIAGGRFYAGFNKKEIKERYKTWEKHIKPYINQEKPGWLDYIHQIYRKVKVASFYIDKYEVTYGDYGDYKEFLKSKGHSPLPEWAEMFIPDDNYPVVGVSWYDANAYCEWKGKRLPTQDEWEFVARGTERRKYPWGNQKPDGTRGNYADINSDVPWKDKYNNDGYKYLAPVGSYPKGATPKGIYDLGGNVKEWTATLNWKKKTVVTKGGSFENHWDDMQGADQRVYAADVCFPSIGFRCASDNIEKENE